MHSEKPDQSELDLRPFALHNLRIRESDESTETPSEIPPNRPNQEVSSLDGQAAQGLDYITAAIRIRYLDEPLATRIQSLRDLLGYLNGEMTVLDDLRDVILADAAESGPRTFETELQAFNLVVRRLAMARDQVELILTALEHQLRREEQRDQQQE